MSLPGLKKGGKGWGCLKHTCTGVDQAAKGFGQQSHGYYEKVCAIVEPPPTEEPTEPPTEEPTDVPDCQIGKYFADGPRIKFTDAADLEGCMEHCENDGDCTCFIFDSIRPRCVLKKDCTGVVGSATGHVAGYKGCALPPPDAPENCEDRDDCDCKPGKYFKDGPLLERVVEEDMTLDRCNDLCVEHSECECFIFDSERDRCALKKECTGALGRADGHVSGFRGCSLTAHP